MDTERARARLGTTLKGRYRLDAVIGVGGMAVVYRGAHRNGNRVAVKVLHPELSVIDDLRVRFLKEGYVANAVDHPGAVRVLDDDITEDGQVFLVMELLEGETLEHLWRDAPDRRIATRDVVEHTMQVLATLGAAHQQQIVHRDIKFTTRGSDLQYACTFALAAYCTCGEPIQAGCDCVKSSDAPLCTSGYNRQVRGKAYPTPRVLRVAKALGGRGVVGSICPLDGDGYTSTMNRIADRVLPKLVK